MTDEETSRRLDRIEKLLEQILNAMLDDDEEEDEDDEDLLEKALKRRDHLVWIV